MPIVPPNTNMTGTGKSPLGDSPSPENLLMAAATMDQMGKFSPSEGKGRVQRPPAGPRAPKGKGLLR